MLVTNFPVASFKTRTFILRHIIVSHYVPSLSQKNIALREQHWMRSLDNALPSTSAGNSLQECQQIAERPEHGYNYSFSCLDGDVCTGRGLG
jgi:hypothetical protein